MKEQDADDLDGYRNHAPTCAQSADGAIEIMETLCMAAYMADR